MVQKWEYNTYQVLIRTKGVSPQTDPSLVWTRKDKDGQTSWDTIARMGTEGWELVSVTAVTENVTLSSYTNYLLYTFKRPLEP
jgi:hypothetical protein